MLPPAYSSRCELPCTARSGCALAFGSVSRSSGMVHLSVIEVQRRFVGPAEGAREHAPDEDAERAETHHQGGHIGSDDLEIDGHRVCSLVADCAAALPAGAASARCGAPTRGT